MKFKPYEKYKKVDLPWIDEIPSHWEVNKVKYKFNLVKEPSTDKDPTVLSLTQKGIKIRDIESNEGQLAKSYEGYNTVKKGYICLNPMDLESGAASKSEYNGVISNAYFTIRPKGFDINSDFYSKYFNLHYKKKIFYGFGKGVGRPEGSGGRWTLNRETFTNFPILSPPKEEQNKISDFLDYNLGKIDKFVELTEKQIELLEEQKEVIINDSVTKGVNKNVEYKDSGIDWIGEIPAHWEITRLKYLTNSNLISLSNNEEKDKEIEYIDIGSVGFLKLKLEPVKMLFGEAPSRARRVVKKGDIIISTVRTYLKSMLYIDENLSNKIVSTGFSVLTPKGDINSNYLKYSISGNNLIQNIIKSSVGVAYPAINDDRLMSLKIVYCRNKEEQKEIVAHIEKETSKIDRTIGLYKNQIGLIKEYRTRLIASAVTGKIDVRDF